MGNTLSGWFLLSFELATNFAINASFVAKSAGAIAAAVINNFLPTPLDLSHSCSPVLSTEDPHNE